MKTPLVPDWPAVLRREMAALYISVSPGTFDAMAANLPPPITVHGTIKGWLRVDLDGWLVGLRDGVANHNEPVWRAPGR